MCSRILIIEDDVLIRDELKILLENEGYSADCVTEFENIPDQIRQISPDLILLDVNLPERDGYSICASIRRFCKTPVLFLTGRSTAMDELEALTVGGDDYIAKPCNIPVLLARIKNLLYRSGGKTDPVMEYKGIRLNPVAGTVSVGKREVELTKTELKILYYLFRRPGEIVSRLDLTEYLWDNAIHIDDNALSVNIMRLRGKLRELGADGLIRTKRGMGYRI